MVISYYQELKVLLLIPDFYIFTDFLQFFRVVFN